MHKSRRKVSKRKTRVCCHFPLRLLTSRACEKINLFLLSVVHCYGSPSRLIHRTILLEINYITSYKIQWKMSQHLWEIRKNTDSFWKSLNLEERTRNVSLSSLLASILYLSPLWCNMEWQRLWKIWLIRHIQK